MRRAFFGCTLLAAFAACAGGGDAGRASLVADLSARFPAASAILAEARAGDVTRTPRGRLGLRSHVETKKTGQWVSLARPVAVEAQADGALRVDTGRGVVVARRAGARPARAESDSGTLVLRDASPGVDAVLVARDHGVEELLRVRAAEAVLAYDLELPKGWSVRPARGFPDRVEVCDARDVPWLRLVAGEAWAEDGRAIAVRPVIEGRRVRLALAERPAGEVVVDPEWQSTAGLNKQRYGGTATLLATGQVLFVGGEGGYNRPGLDSTELFDPDTNTVTGGPTMATARFSHAAVALPNGKVLIAGGTADVLQAGHQPGLASAELYDSRTNVFEATGDLAHARFRHSGTLLPTGKVLVTGGSSDVLEALASSELYDYSTGKFEPAGDMPAARQRHAATLLVDGRVLVTGGVRSLASGVPDAGPSDCLSTTVVFDGKGTFAEGPALTSKRCEHGALRVPDGRVVLMGGSAVFATKDELADPATKDQWRERVAEYVDPAGGPTTPLPAGEVADGVVPQGRAAVALLPDGRALQASGVDANGAQQAAAALLDPDASPALVSLPGVDMELPNLTPLPTGNLLLSGARTSLWIYDSLDVRAHASGTLTEPRNGHTASLLPTGDVLIAGGDQGTKPLASLVVFRSATGTFEPLEATLSQPATYHTATTLLDGMVLLAGGLHAGSASANQHGNVFDAGPPARVLDAVPLVARRCSHAATLLPDGRVLLTGGATGATASGLEGVVDTAELFDPATGMSVATKARMSTRRLFHTSTLLPNGKVLIAGGDSAGDASHPLDIAELFDPKTGTFTPTATPMVTPRYWHAAVPLADGKVLLAGGGSGAELYDPWADTFTPITAPVDSLHSMAAAVLLSGNVVFTGGTTDANEVMATVQRFDPVTQQMTVLKSATLGSPRVFHTTTLLPDGGLLTVGGMASLSPAVALSSTEWLGGPVLRPAVEKGRPKLSAAPAQVHAGEASSVAGSLFSPLGEGAGGLHASSAILGVARWVPALGAPQAGLLVPSSGTEPTWTATRGTWTPLAPFQPGAGLLFVVTHGLPSEGIAVRVLPAMPGTPCRGAAQCASGVCADGVCCDLECSGPCRACSATLKSRGMDGVCEVVTEGTNPRMQCAAQAECSVATDACDGSGSCRTCPGVGPHCEGHVLVGADAGADCAPYQCAKDVGSCRSACDSKLDCVPGYSCSAKRTCEPSPADEPLAGCTVATPRPRSTDWVALALAAAWSSCGIGRRWRRAGSRAAG